METNAQHSPKKVSLGLVAGWVFGVLFIIVGIVQLTEGALLGAIAFILAGALVLPPLVELVASKTHIVLSRGLTVVVVIILLAVAGTSISGEDTAGSLADSVAVAEQKPIEVISISATQLHADYKENEVAADGKYKGKTVRVTGAVGTIGKDILDTPFVTLGTEEYFTHVQCMFSNKDTEALSKLAKGERVVLQGEVSGLSILNVLVRQCQIVE